MRNLANVLHMVANHQKYFPHWTRERYARMWSGLNCYETIVCQYPVI